MGADMFIAALAVHADTELNWAAAEAAITALDQETLGRLADTFGWDVEDDDHTEYEAATERLRNAVQEVNGAITGETTLRRDLSTLQFGEWTIHITGGLSTGDTPGDLFDSFWALEESGIEQAIGFGWPPTHRQGVTDEQPSTT